jgi:rod shape-determining protein MreD
MRKTLFYILTAWILLWGQVLSNHGLGGGLIAVHWVLISVLYFGLWYGPRTGESLGFVCGLLLDASSLGLLGLHAILFALAGYVAGVLRRQIDASQDWSQGIFTWMVSVVYFGLYMVLERIFGVTEQSFQWTFLTVPIVNAAMAPLVFRALRLWSQAWEMAPVEH